MDQGTVEFPQELIDAINAPILAAIAALEAKVDAIKAKTDNLPAIPAARSDVQVTVNPTLTTAEHDQLMAIPTVAPDNAGISAIKAKTDNLPADPASNTTVNTRLAASGYTAPDNSGIAAIQAVTDQITFTVGRINAEADFTGIATTLDVTTAEANIIAAVEATAPRGDTPVNADYPTPGNLRAVDGNGVAVDGATILAYTKTDYVSGSRVLRGSTITDADGNWTRDMYLDQGVTYVLVYYKDGAFQATAREITI